MRGEFFYTSLYTPNRGGRWWTWSKVRQGCRMDSDRVVPRLVACSPYLIVEVVTYANPSRSYLDMSCAQGTITPLAIPDRIHVSVVEIIHRPPPIHAVAAPHKVACRSCIVCLGPMRCRESRRSLHQLRCLLHRVSHTSTEEEEGHDRRISGKRFRQVQLAFPCPSSSRPRARPFTCITSDCPK